MGANYIPRLYVGWELDLHDAKRLVGTILENFEDRDGNEIAQAISDLLPTGVRVLDGGNAFTGEVVFFITIVGTHPSCPVNNLDIELLERTRRLFDELEIDFGPPVIGAAVVVF